MTEANKALLALVDDDDMLRPVLAANLGQAGYGVEAFADPAAALTALANRRFAPDLLILDWRMPQMTGLELLQQLRAAAVNTPALFFTSHNDTLYEEAALSCGAVDFIDKTRSFAILLKRVEIILERTQQAQTGPTPKRIGQLNLDAANHTVQWRGAKIDLTFGEYRVIDLLVRAGRDVTYRELYDALRGENFVAGDGVDGYRANVRALIKRIREKFTASDSAFAAIANYPGYGYRWVDPSDA